MGLKNVQHSFSKRKAGGSEDLGRIITFYTHPYIQHVSPIN